MGPLPPPSSRPGLGVVAVMGSLASWVVASALLDALVDWQLSLDTGLTHVRSHFVVGSK